MLSLLYFVWYEKGVQSVKKYDFKVLQFFGNLKFDLKNTFY